MAQEEPKRKKGEKLLAVLRIRQLGEPVLRRKAKLVQRLTAQDQQLIDDMIETALAAEGAGLAANQVGVAKQIAVVRYDDRIQELVNPRILEHSQEKVTQQEGCLSLPGLQGEVERYVWATVRAQDREGKTIELSSNGLCGRAFQHEMDHLQGRLYIDIAEEGTLSWISHELPEDQGGEENIVLTPTTLEEVREVFAVRLHEPGAVLSKG